MYEMNPVEHYTLSRLTPACPETVRETLSKRRVSPRTYRNPLRAKKPKGARKPSHSRRESIECYSNRNSLLRGMGFTSYSDYLRSDLWTSIRERVFERKGKTCCCCESKASQVHHSSYDSETLRGATLTSLWPICHHCHERIEMNGKSKRSPTEVAEMFALMCVTADEGT